ncbi:MAG: metallophosphoesterase [Candidatus Brocadiales bacterium]
MSARGKPKSPLITRRDFLKVAASTTALGSLGAFSLDVTAQESGPSFTFAYVSDTHLYERKLNERFIKAIEKAINDMNSLDPQPDFILFGGDLAQLGQPKELELGKEFLDQLKAPVRMIVGEHDWYLDMGEKWRELFGEDIYSFDHKGVHFVVLNSVIVEDYWTGPKMTPMERMKFMAQLDNPKGRPFTVGEEQRAWLKDDLSKVDKSTPLVVFSHSPLYKYYRSWNFWTDDAEQVQAILNEFDTVTVVHGHTHQLLTNQIGNITFHGMLSTAWPWPYAPEGIPNLTIQMDRADPFDQFDGCGDGTVDVLPGGQVNKRYNLWARKPRLVTYEGVRRLWSTRGIGLFEPGPSY